MDGVRAAVACAEGDNAAIPLPAGFRFDREAAAEKAAIAAADWRLETEPGLIVTLVAKLARLRKLEADFAQTLEAAKLESLKELAYGAGHEINNPLANISARAQALLTDERHPQRRRMLASIHAQALRAHEMIADMMLFARPPAPRPESLDVGQLVTQVHAELLEAAAQQQTELALRLPREPIEIIADKTQIAVAVRSLCVNALEAVASGGRVEIAVEEPAPADAHVRVVVSDDGPGIPAETRPHVFDPFFSGREAGRGLGLGLSKCWRIVTLHGGSLDVASANGRGAVFTVSLPRGNTR
jgi:signal transduction histidine kinase